MYFFYTRLWGVDSIIDDPRLMITLFKLEGGGLKYYSLNNNMIIIWNEKFPENKQATLKKKKHNVRQKNKEAAKRTMTAASSIIIMFSFPFWFCVIVYFFFTLKFQFHLFKIFFFLSRVEGFSFFPFSSSKWHIHIINSVFSINDLTRTVVTIA